MNEIIHGDSYEILPTIPEKSVDMILTDPPYGVTALKWDSIDLEKFWTAIKRVIKDNGAIVVFSSQPFTSELILSNKAWYRYEIIWEKAHITNFWYVKRQIARCHENIEVFYQKQPTYNVIKFESRFRHEKGSRHKQGLKNRFDIFQGKQLNVKPDWQYNETGKRYPRSVVKCSHEPERHDSSKVDKKIHHTQKPVELFQFLIRTYTNEGDIVLDPFSGSGTTALASKRFNRRFLCIEKEQKFYEFSLERLEGDTYQPELDLNMN